MRCFTLSLATVALLFVLGLNTAVAQDAAETAPSFQPADVQIQASRVFVFVEKTGLVHQHGVEAKLNASTLVLAANENAGQLVFDMTSFDADTPVARKYVGLSGTTDDGTRTAVNKNMKGSAVLNVTQFPTATFDVASAKATGQTSGSGLPVYQLDGQFTLHGTKRPLSIMVEVEQSRGWLYVRDNFTIKQTDFGITRYSKAFGAIGVADELKIYGDLFVAPNPNVAMTDIPARQ